MTAEALGFDRPMSNSLDAVADRDFALEFLGAASICAMLLNPFSTIQSSRVLSMPPICFFPLA